MTAASAPLKAPFPWFGGKRKLAPEVWARFGDVRNYVEPFAGSLAVLLGRPGGAAGVETVNDLDCYLANFWRALAHDPDAVARHADWPVNEADLHARHQWLVDRAEFRERMKTDPDFFDPKIAGWWVWGQCAWIGTGWCDARKWRDADPGQGVHRKLPHLAPGRGVNSQLPERGVNRKLPELDGTGTHGRGVHSPSNNGDLLGYMRRLSERLRRVRVACGDWSRLTSQTVTWGHGLTGVLLDPPYGEGSMKYAAGGNCADVAAAVASWAADVGERPDMRIAVCSYSLEMPAGWTRVKWVASGGYSLAGDADNRFRETVWFSPHCLRQPGDRVSDGGFYVPHPRQPALFEAGGHRR